MGEPGYSSVDVGDLRLAVWRHGDPAAPTVVLVHGFPDTSRLWDGVVAELARRFHVVRYDVRGCGRSGAPAGVEGYRVGRLAEDLVAVVRAVAPGRAVHLVGHDWGSVTGWEAVTEPTHSGLFASFTSVSGPSLDHLGTWVRSAGVRDVPALLTVALRSAYTRLFRSRAAGVLAPVIARKSGARVRDVLRGFQLYRANLPVRAPRARPCAVPVQLVVPTRDAFVRPAHLAGTARWAERLWRREVPAGHWAPRTHPAVLARMVGEFVAHVEGAAPARGLRAARSTRRFGEKVVLVTGGASGIGRATARAFAAAGADVVVVDRDGDGARAVAREAGGTAFAVDVTDGEAVTALAARVREQVGVPDVVVANAGVAVAGPFLETSVADWQRVVDVNLWGVVHTLRAFAPQLVERGEGGSLVVTASMAGYTPSRTLPAYATTKAAVLMLAQCLRGELAGHGIGVTAICPGFVHTNITRAARFAGADAATEARLRAETTRRYLRRGFPPEKVASAVLDAVERDVPVRPVTAEAHATALLGRLSPALLRWGARLDLNPRE
ncbi:NAD(P)-dependent dehydrogenase (short-subunit alcohol dehydrogenase family)/pimeloyl-ACP methyl ester carboxylesterase [Crossiella equi]|uniref:NAD(P)-dependent dehydrogenase (Short-subunit alcohol dehydrogenase family)/pimeloyl-ACP methyl ester carboxylesterase n=1 Tax=Crossiella equi TaxID=130796 RepID=A0ABS5ACW5_9PSEU|nr:SDR family oxidoreductase [Crossiella equi]MBP2474421.1 NAD(P)-dependent dehydrogenase (short-subunit alcohol dehydrogenase family)/pimeloyl-ACP methyl ester carboxylesterase [Crossiella equi]